jgi:hypothetical protein
VTENFLKSTESTNQVLGLSCSFMSLLNIFHEIFSLVFWSYLASGNISQEDTLLVFGLYGGWCSSYQNPKLCGFCQYIELWRWKERNIYPSHERDSNLRSKLSLCLRSCMPEVTQPRGSAPQSSALRYSSVGNWNKLLWTEYPRKVWKKSYTGKYLIIQRKWSCHWVTWESSLVYLRTSGLACAIVVMATVQQKVNCFSWFAVLKSVTWSQLQFRLEYGGSAPSNNSIKTRDRCLRDIGGLCVSDVAWTSKDIQRRREKHQTNPLKSISTASRQLLSSPLQNSWRTQTVV